MADSWQPPWQPLTGNPWRSPAMARVGKRPMTCGLAIQGDTRRWRTADF